MRPLCCHSLPLASDVATCTHTHVSYHGFACGCAFPFKRLAYFMSKGGRLPSRPTEEEDASLSKTMAHTTINARFLNCDGSCLLGPLPSRLSDRAFPVLRCAYMCKEHYEYISAVSTPCLVLPLYVAFGPTTAPTTILPVTVYMVPRTL